MPNDNNNSNAAAKKPTYIAYHISEKEGCDGFLTRIGAAWAHKDNKGFSIQLDGLMPLDGRITLRLPEEKPAE